MSTYAVCARFVEGAGREVLYLLNVLMPFAQENTLKIALDADGKVLADYVRVSENSQDIATWLRFIGKAFDSNCEIIELPELRDDSVYIEVAKNIARDGKLIVWSHQHYQNDNSDEIDIIDRTEAIMEFVHSKSKRKIRRKKRSPLIDNKVSTLVNVNNKLTFNSGCGVVDMSEPKYKVENSGQIGNIGDNGAVWGNAISSGVSGNVLEQELKKVLAAARGAADSSDKAEAIRQLEKATTEIISGNQAGALKHLGAAGHWALGIAKELGSDVIVKLIKEMAGMS